MYGKEGEISIARNENEHHEELVSCCGKIMVEEVTEEEMRGKCSH